jgi:hypothetical protein
MALDPQDMAFDPRREELLSALAKVRVHAARLEAALDSAHSAFTGKAVWVGPAAREFTRELTGRRTRLRELTRRIVEDLENELRSTPEKAAPSSAAW